MNRVRSCLAKIAGRYAPRPPALPFWFLQSELGPQMPEPIRVHRAPVQNELAHRSQPILGEERAWPSVSGASSKRLRSIMLCTAGGTFG
jgi:hypothetical protein